MDEQPVDEQPVDEQPVEVDTPRGSQALVPGFGPGQLATIATPTRRAQQLEKFRELISSRLMRAGVGVSAIAMIVTSPSTFGLLPLAVVGGYLAVVFAFNTRLRRFRTRLAPFYQKTEAGDFGLVIEHCRTAMSSAPWPVSHSAALRLAYFLRRQADFDQAIALCHLASQNDEDGRFHTLISIELAVCYALKGEMKTAKTWLPPQKRGLGALSASFAIVWARDQKSTGIYKLRIKPRRHAAEFLRHELRLLAVLKAFELYQQRPDYLSIRPLLLEAGPAFPTEFDYLGVHWPAMKEFIDTYVAPKAGE